MARSGGPDFSLVVGQQLGISLDEFFPNDVLSDGIGELSNVNVLISISLWVPRPQTRRPPTHLDEMVREHIPNPPTLIRPTVLQVLPQIGLDLLVLELTTDGDQVGDGQQPHAVLIVGGETLVERDDLGFEQGRVGGECFGVGLLSNNKVV